LVSNQGGDHTFLGKGFASFARDVLNVAGHNRMVGSNTIAASDELSLKKPRFVGTCIVTSP
jgi:hypothetical protein